MFEYGKVSSSSEVKIQLLYCDEMTDYKGYTTFSKLKNFHSQVIDDLNCLNLKFEKLWGGVVLVIPFLMNYFCFCFNGKHFSVFNEEVQHLSVIYFVLIFF